jgi:hypothetical protein
MKSQPLQILREGRAALDPILGAHGFSFKEGGAGRSSGGPYASGIYVNGNRTLEIHFRFSLGLVTYHFGERSVDHESYMRAALGRAGGNHYPGFSDDPISGFENLAYDLQHFATAFLTGDFNEFARYVTAAEEWKKIPGLARLP